MKLNGEKKKVTEEIPTQMSKVKDELLWEIFSSVQIYHETRAGMKDAKHRGLEAVWKLW